MKKLVESYINKTFGPGVIQDLQLAIGKGFNPFNMLNPKTLSHPDSEVHFRKKLLVNKVRTVMRSASALDMHALVDENPAARVLFVNGIVTSYPLARHQANILAQSIGQEVALVHNETDGLIKDLLECNEGRSGVINEVAEKTIAAIEEKLTSSCQPLTIVAYSQGAIIVTSALQYLSAKLPKQEIARIRYITFGAGFKTSVLSDELFCEHFANTDDPITLLGLQHDDFPFSGKLYLRKAKGHFLIADYLVPMMQGIRYGDSWFEQQVAEHHQAK